MVRARVTKFCAGGGSVSADNAVGYILGFIAAAFAGMNVVGGYVVTDRMLGMFRKRPAAPLPAVESAPVDASSVTGTTNASEVTR